MKCLFKIFLLILSVFFTIKAQNHFTYFPIHIGDTWEWYDNIHDSTSSVSILKIIEKNDSSIDVYTLDSEKPRYNVKSNGNVYQYFGDSLEIWYDFTVAPGDTFYTKVYSEPYYVVVDSSEGELFGVHTIFRKFTWTDVKYQAYISMQTVSDKFGLCSAESWLGPLDEYVVGCKINGQTYGSLVSIEDNNLTMLSAFQLYQNYPNPFNPDTKIKYSINKSSFVNITIYNLLGEKVSTLINEYKINGSYEITFNGQKLPSGIYLCRIVSNNKSKVIKMDLLK